MVLAFVRVAIAAPRMQRSSLPLALRWSVDVGAPRRRRAAPVSDDRLVYLALGTDRSRAYDLADGRERWRKEVKVAHPLATDAGLSSPRARTPSSRSCRRRIDRAGQRGVAITAPLCARRRMADRAVGRQLLAFRAADGARVWQKDIGATTVRPGIGDDKSVRAARRREDGGPAV